VKVYPFYCFHSSFLFYFFFFITLKLL
jgi:hypothetical protein